MAFQGDNTCHVGSKKKGEKYMMKNINFDWNSLES